MGTHDPSHRVPSRAEACVVDTGDSLAFHTPPVTRTAQGAVRCVGVEVEFQGIRTRAAAHALVAGFGGILVEEDPHAFHVLDTAIGRLAVELDIRHVHPQRWTATPPIRLLTAGAAWFGTVLNPVVPRELITAPLPIERLGLVDRAVGVLRAAGASGCGVTRFGSLGLHFNIDPPRIDADMIAATLKAFLLLNARLRHETTAREASSVFLPAPYPDAYVRRVVDPDYWPDLPSLAEDYLAANPTRNRDLDLLPLFLNLDPERVRARLPYEKIGNRAVFHYRLPRAYVSDPAWSVASAWNGWVAVEALAGDRHQIDELGRECRRAPRAGRRPAGPRIRGRGIAMAASCRNSTR